MSDAPISQMIVSQLDALLREGRITGDQIAKALLEGVEAIQADRVRMRTALVRIANCEERPALIASQALGLVQADSPRRAYYETHEPPHCPTCDCGHSLPLEQLRRIDQTARAFVNTVPESMTFRGAQGAFNALCDALFDGRPLKQQKQETDNVDREICEVPRSG